VNRSLRYVLREIRRNGTSPSWWRDRVFVPYVVGTLTQLHPAYPGYDEAVRVMEEDWDTLILLDACRADIFESVVDLDRYDGYRRAVSLGSHSSEWTRRNFGDGQFGDTVYVSANPHTTLLANDTFHEIVEVWKNFECSPNMIPPHELVEAAVDAHERYPNKRLIVHFMQPHGTGQLVEGNPADRDVYRRTVEAMQDVVHALADDIGGRTVVTADHGELFTTGLRYALGIRQHRARLRYPALVEVPWAEIDGERRRITTGEQSSTETTEETVRERLEDLGYHA
jgi:hypothetical protein